MSIRENYLADRLKQDIKRASTKCFKQCHIYAQKQNGL